MDTIQKKDLFYSAKESFNKMNFKEAEDIFFKSYREEKCEKSLEYLLYFFLIRSNYRELAHIFQSGIKPSGFALYSLYWYKFMTGELDELSDILYKMLSDNNYFLRVYAIKELQRMKKIEDPQQLIKQKIKFFGLSYELPIEEQRASFYMDFMFQRYHLSIIQGKSLLKEYPAIGDVYIDFIEICEKSGNAFLIKDIITHDSFNKLAETDYRLLYIQSRELYKMGRLDESKEILDRLISFFRHNPLFHYNLGNIYSAKEKFLKAADSYEEAISLAPLFERAYYNLGCVYFKLRDMNRAVKNLGEAVKISKKPDALYNLSISLIEKKELQDAYYYLNKIPDWYSPKCPPSSIKEQIKELAVFT
jgi:tetratricopeptide (TPR) repeat protein